MHIQEVFYTLGDQIRRAERTQQQVVTISLADARYLQRLIAPPKLNSQSQHAVERCAECGYIHGGHKSTCSKVSRRPGHTPDPTFMKPTPPPNPPAPSEPFLETL